MELNPARMELIYGFFETYLKLTKEEELLVEKEIAKLPVDEAEKILELPNSYFERGIKEGIKEGIREGIEKRDIEVVNNMHKRGLSNDVIADFTGISLERVEKILTKCSDR